MRDALLVARFELLRAIRTWRALALLALYGVASAGASWIFVKAIGAMERATADLLQVPRTRTPGAMLDQLVQSEVWRDAVGDLTGLGPLVDHLLDVPPMAIFYLWLSFGLVPFFAASASAESVAIDVASRAVRYELLRTGRLELALGRFLGQLMLTAGGTIVSMLAVYGVALGFLAKQHPVELGLALLSFAPWAFAFGVPFVACGVAASLLTTSAAWARVMAVGATAGSWVLLGVAAWFEETDRGWLADVIVPLLPQGWLLGFWEPGLSPVMSAVAVSGIGLSLFALAFVRFARRDL